MTKTMVPGATKLEQRMFKKFHFEVSPSLLLSFSHGSQNLERNCTVTSDLAESLICISKSCNAALRRKKEQTKELSSWNGKILPHLDAPAMSIVGQDLLVTFPDYQSVLEMLLCDVVGFPFASAKESNCSGARLHSGFLRNLTQVSKPLHLLLLLSPTPPV
jgi:hypothetical protein